MAANPSVPATGNPPTPANTVPPGYAKIQALKDATVAENARLRAESDKLNSPVTKFTLPSFVDIVELQNIYAAIRDGDAWTAFTRSVQWLNGFLNPPRTVNQGLRTTAPKPMTEADIAELDRTIDLLEKQTSKVKVAGDEKVTPQPRVGRQATAENTEISFAEVITVVQMVLNIVKQFRNRNK